jgi:hypothetical protein
MPPAPPAKQSRRLLTHGARRQPCLSPERPLLLSRSGQTRWATKGGKRGREASVLACFGVCFGMLIIFYRHDVGMSMKAASAACASGVRYGWSHACSVSCTELGRLLHSHTRHCAAKSAAAGVTPATHPGLEAALHRPQHDATTAVCAHDAHTMRTRESPGSKHR